MAMGYPQIPAFVIEVVSSNDQINRVHKKMQNYRDAGVKVVWLIFPLLQEVQVYYGDHLDHMRVCKGDTSCSAAPVLPDFTPTAADIFRLPTPMQTATGI